MKVERTKRFKRDYKKLPEAVKRQFGKQIRLLMENPRHPSLNSHKMQGYFIWEARVSKDYRFTYIITEAAYILRRIGTHEIYKNPKKIGDRCKRSPIN